MPHLRADADRAGLLPRNIRELNHRQEVSKSHRSQPTTHTRRLKLIQPRRFLRINWLLEGGGQHDKIEQLDDRKTY